MAQFTHPLPSSFPHGCYFVSLLLHFPKAPCRWPGKMVEDGLSLRDPAPTRETHAAESGAPGDLCASVSLPLKQALKKGDQHQGNAEVLKES